VPYLNWNSTPTTEIDARATLEAIIELAKVELPFAAQVGRLAQSATTADELERFLASLYRIALDHGHWVLPDLVDGLLRWIEQQPADMTLHLPWNEAVTRA
jgi:hypothetical protein